MSRRQDRRAQRGKGEVMKDEQIEIANTIIEAGLEQIQRSTRVTMEHHLYGEALDVARSMRNRLGIITDVVCDWPECQVTATLTGSPHHGRTAEGWLIHCDHGRGYDLCPQHAAPFKERKWVVVRAGEWQENWATCYLHLVN